MALAAPAPVLARALTGSGSCSDRRASAVGCRPDGGAPRAGITALVRQRRCLGAETTSLSMRRHGPGGGVRMMAGAGSEVEEDEALMTDEDMTEVQVPPVLDSSNPALQERFAVLDTGLNECKSCGYVYDQTKGDDSYPISPGTSMRSLPEDWRCPTCGAAKSMFQSKSLEVAGFAQNQQYGLGGNSLTAGQKSILIYGSLLFFFALFLSGYFLQ